MKYIIETRVHLTVADDEEAKLQIATMLGLYKIAVEEGAFKITDIELGLLRDGEPVPLPLSNVHLLHPKED